MNRRLKKIILIFLYLFFFGLIYYLFIESTGYAIPCIVRAIFKVECPTCGITRMILNMMMFNFKEAISFNYGLFYLMPFILFIIIYYIVRYIKNGILKFNRFLTVCVSILCVLLIVWGIVRNIYQI